jgi:hypothetical protein
MSRCPHCQNDGVVEGRIFNQTDYIAPRAFFRPNGFPFYAVFGTNVLMDNKFFACPSCGYLWSNVDADKLKKVFANSRKYRNEEGQSQKSGEVYELDKGEG